MHRISNRIDSFYTRLNEKHLYLVKNYRLELKKGVEKIEATIESLSNIRFNTQLMAMKM